MSIKDVRGIPRPGMFEEIRDEDGNVYKPVSGSGRKTRFSVNGSEETVSTGVASQHALRHKAEAKGLVEPRSSMDLLFYVGD